MSKKVVMITGCLGFIGSHVTRKCLKEGWYVMGVDKETYASNLDHCQEFSHYPNFTYINKDIGDIERLPDCDYIINTAAETHVDNSISKSKVFLDSNINGVYNLLELLRHQKQNRPILLHFSTDEVYGDIEEGTHSEECLLKPSNPYSASKASADQLILAWHKTYDVPYVILRPTNNYGLGQYVEKLIPKAIKYLRLGRKVPLHNHGTPRRMWLHADDTASAVMTVISSEVTNEIFNICGDTELPNIEVVKSLISMICGDDCTHTNFIDFSFSRDGQDVRYSIDDSKLRKLGWKPKKDFNKELENIVNASENFVW